MTTTYDYRAAGITFHCRNKFLDTRPRDAHDAGMTDHRDPNACPEPDGNSRPTYPEDHRSAHRIMLDEVGHCPWCGTEEES